MPTASMPYAVTATMAPVCESRKKLRIGSIIIMSQVTMSKLHAFALMRMSSERSSGGVFAVVVAAFIRQTVEQY